MAGNEKRCRWIVAFLALSALPAPGRAWADKPAYPGIWGIWGFPRIAQAPPPWYKGHVVTVTWEQIEPADGRFDWAELDARIHEAADRGLYVMFMVYHASKCPAWIFEKGVAKLVADTGTVYPNHLDPNYKSFLKRMIQETARHVQTAFAPAVRERIIAVQCPVGKSGDPQPYQNSTGAWYGQGTDYPISEEQWMEHQKELFRWYYGQYAETKPRIYCLFNSIYGGGTMHQWLVENLPGFWCKTNRIGDRYQNNGEMRAENYYRWLTPTLRQFQNGFAVRARSEMDLTGRGWFKEAPLWNMYWTQLWGLHCGQDMHNQTNDDLDKTEYYPAFEFYSRYAGFKDPRDSVGVWCALRDGLDCADTQRFPESQYGALEAGRNPQRYLKIAEACAPYGARQSDPKSPSKTSWEGLNDVGLEIEPGNCQMWLYQRDPSATSQGLWRQGPLDQMYGRFARRFDHASGKDAMAFDIDDRFFFDPKTLEPEPLAGRYPVKARVAYLDEGTGSWALKYDAVGDPEKTALTMKKTNTGRWKEAVAAIEDGQFANRCGPGCDLMLVNADAEDDTFHLIEVTRETGDRKGYWGQGG